MAHFIGYIQGNRGEASRLGSKDSGIRASAQGWHIGASINIFNNTKGEDIVVIYVTKGSNGYGHDLFLGKFKLNEKGEIIKIKED